MNYDEFIFKEYRYDKNNSTLRMGYGYKNGPDFEEVVTFPINKHILAENTEQVLDRAFRLIFLLSGVSYYKAYVPKVLRCVAFPLEKSLADFLRIVYLNGLGEFAFRNNLGLHDRINFVVDTYQSNPPIALNLRQRLLVPVGGGKDSIVTLETLKQAGEEPTLFALGTHAGVASPILATIENSGLPSLIVNRTLSHNLFDLNKRDAYNGHIPVTAILSSIAIATAILHDYNTVVLSNEHSASSPNIIINGFEINHQYSKSLAFETALSDHIYHSLSPDIHYFSLLRPLAEAEITRRFSYFGKYHDSFRSCNTAFRQDQSRRNKNWCCNCPKCRFIFLALAPFLDKQKLIDIFSHNMLNDENQIAGYNDLCGISAHKPFECVGEIEECVLLMHHLSKTKEWADDVVVKIIGQATTENDFDLHIRYQTLFKTRYDHRLSQKFIRMLDA